MEAVFLKILNMSINAGWLVLAVLALRLIMKKSPQGRHGHDVGTGGHPSALSFYTGKCF